MAEAKAEVLEEIEDGREDAKEDGEEEDAVDAVPVSLGNTALRRVGPSRHGREAGEDSLLPLGTNWLGAPQNPRVPRMRRSK